MATNHQCYNYANFTEELSAVHGGRTIPPLPKSANPAAARGRAGEHDAYLLQMYFFFFQLSVIIQNPLELLQQPRRCPIDPTVAIDEVTGYGLIRRAQGQRGRGRGRGGHAGMFEPVTS